MSGAVARVLMPFGGDVSLAAQLNKTESLALTARPPQLISITQVTEQELNCKKNNKKKMHEDASWAIKASCMCCRFGLGKWG